MASNQPILSADQYPFNDIALISVKWPDGTSSTGTGAIVGRNDVLTASHVVYSADHGGGAKEVTIYPGYDYSEPNPSVQAGFRIDFLDSHVQRSLISEHDVKLDFAVIGLADEFSNWFSLSSAYFNGPSEVPNVRQSGYDGGLRSLYGTFIQGYSTGSVKRIDSDAIWNTSSLSAGPGDSGSPLWVDSPNGPTLIGLVSTGDWGMAVTDASLAVIQSWMNGNDNLLPSSASMARVLDAGSDDLISLSSLASSGAPVTVNAGAGWDTLVLSNARSAYTVQKGSAGGIALTSKSTGQVYDLVGVNVLRYSDQSNYVVSDAQAPIARLYKAAFGRAPDDAGLNYWLNKSGGGPEEIARSFLASNEFRKLGSLDNAQFADLLYHNSLGRAPDAAGLAWWTDQLNHGVSRDLALRSFVDFPESQAASNALQSSSGFLYIVGSAGLAI